MRVVEIYEKGGFPQLVLAAKKDFAGTYGLHGEYWQSRRCEQVAGSTELRAEQPEDLANHYHAQYQDPKQHEQQAANYGRGHALVPGVSDLVPHRSASTANDYQLADLMLENHDYAAAAHEYEVTAYDYPPHAKSAAAGYAAIYAHREYLKVASADVKDAARRDTINSSIKFADAFPQHEQAAVVLAAAAEDAYEMKDSCSRATPAGTSSRSSRMRPWACAAMRGWSSHTPPSASRSMQTRSRPTGTYLKPRAGRCIECRAGGEPGGLHLQAGRAGKPGRGLPHRGQSLRARQAGCSHVEDLRGGGVTTPARPCCA